MRPDLDRIGGQILEEWTQFQEICRGTTSYLEVGARDGLALRYLVGNLKTIDKVVAVDWPEQRWGRKGSRNELEGILTQLRAMGRHPTSIYGDSQDESIVSQVQEFAPYDVVFIDADHTYEGVKADLANYGPMATVLIGMHDINHPEDSKAYGPTRLFNKVKNDYRRYETFIAEGSRTGIGVLWK